MSDGGTTNAQLKPIVLGRWPEAISRKYVKHLMAKDISPKHGIFTQRLNASYICIYRG